MSKELQIVEGLKHASEFRGRMLERKRILELIENNFYPLDYARWQADELLDELVRLIKGDAE